MKVFLVLLFGLLSGSLAFADDDHERNEAKGFAVNDNVYLQECGSCHLAYPPQLLDKKSWQVIMQSLDKHFGDNAEMDKALATQISRFLEGNAASSGFSRRSHNSASGRITETSFFRHEHDELSPRHVAQNPEVKSLANCSACHRRAKVGSFRESEIRIPGFGRWDD
ncbi:MAG: diheme cytochrome c [Gammaproteobacteria bacterium]|nr:diheme cytochrome c [Gammaproteobacteria bacterium]